MRIPRITLGQIMVATCLFAIDLWALMNGPRIESPGVTLFILGGLPMANILILGTCFLIPRKSDHNFLIGFEALGATVLACYTAISFIFPEAAIGHLRWVALALWTVVKWWFDPPETLVMVLVMVPVMAYYTVPQVLIAVIGGKIHCRDEWRLKRLGQQKE